MKNIHKKRHFIKPCAVTMTDAEFIVAAKLLQHPQIIWSTGWPKVGKTIWALKTASILLQYFEHYVNPMFIGFSAAETRNSTYSYWKEMMRAGDPNSDTIQDSEKGIFAMNFATTMKLTKEDADDKNATGYDFLTDKLYRFIHDVDTNLVIIDGIEDYIDPNNTDLLNRFVNSLTDFLKRYSPQVTIIITANYPCFFPTPMPVSVTSWELYRPAFFEDATEEFGHTYLWATQNNNQ